MKETGNHKGCPSQRPERCVVRLSGEPLAMIFEMPFRSNISFRVIRALSLTRAALQRAVDQRFQILVGNVRDVPPVDEQRGRRIDAELVSVL